MLLGSATSLTASVVTLLLGALIISVHNVWVLDGHVLLTLVGYVLFILAAVRFLVPDLDLGGKKSADANYLVLYGLIGLMVGIVFIYHGFFVG